MWPWQRNCITQCAFHEMKDADQERFLLLFIGVLLPIITVCLMIWFVVISS